MDIIVKGRRANISEKFRRHVENKLSNKLSKWEKKGMNVDVEVSKERNPKLADQRERVELTIHSSGPVIRSEASADERYSAFDLALGRVEARLRKVVNRRKVQKGNRAPVSVATATSTTTTSDAEPETGLGAVAEPSPVPAPGAEPEPETDHTAVDDQFDDEFVELETQGEAPLIVREKVHHAKPMTIDQALMEMELVGHDFYLFHDEERDAPSVVYRRKGFNYGVLRLME